MRRPFAAFVPFALSAILFVAACGGDDGGDADTPKSLRETLFSERAGGDTFAKEQQLVRACMEAQGFQYSPIDNRAGSGAVSFDTSSADFVEQYGFGISTSFLSQIGTRIEDPNQKYRESLDETQRAAYDKALYGNSFSVSPASGSDGGGVEIRNINGQVTTNGQAGDIAEQGCLGKALSETEGERPAFDASLFDQLQDLDKRISGDPRVVAATKKWATCMADSGYQYRDRAEAMAEIRKEFSDLTGIKMEGGDGGGVVFSVAVAVGGSDSKGTDPFANVDKAKLSALQEKEKTIARAAQQCTEKHVASVEEKVRAEYEADFLKDHPELAAQAGKK